MLKKILRGTKILMVFAVVFSLSIPVFAETKEEAQARIDSLESQQEALKDSLENLRVNKESTEAYIAELDAQLKVLMGQIDETNQQLAATEAQLAETQDELDIAKAKEAEQYIALKARIKAMYESGESSYLSVILNAEDISTLLNDAEYMGQISEYDRSLLESLAESRKQIEELQAAIEAQLAEITALKEELESQQESLSIVVAEKEAELVTIEEHMEDVAGDIYNTQAELEVTQDILAAIVAEEERQAALKAAQEAGSGTANIITGGGGDYYDTTVSDSGLAWPCPSSSYISSGYGSRTSPTAGASSNHMGIDIGADSGAAITASASGTVVTASYSEARGNYIVVNHGSISTLYQHCSALYASVGQSVSQGETIAAVGSTGYSTGPHLHFEVLINGSNVNPLYYVSP